MNLKNLSMWETYLKSDHHAYFSCFYILLHRNSIKNEWLIVLVGVKITDGIVSQYKIVDIELINITDGEKVLINSDNYD